MSRFFFSIRSLLSEAQTSISASIVNLQHCDRLFFMIWKRNLCTQSPKTVAGILHMIREDQKIVDTDVLLSRLFVDTKHLLLIEKLLIDVHTSRKFIAFFLLVPSGIFGIHDVATFLCFQLLQNDLGSVPVCGTSDKTGSGKLAI